MEFGAHEHTWSGRFFIERLGVLGWADALYHCNSLDDEYERFGTCMVFLNFLLCPALIDIFVWSMSYETCAFSFGEGCVSLGVTSFTTNALHAIASTLRPSLSGVSSLVMLGRLDLLSHEEDGRREGGFCEDGRREGGSAVVTHPQLQSTHAHFIAPINISLNSFIIIVQPTALANRNHDKHGRTHSAYPLSLSRPPCR
jgi:hypothetical protein